MLRKELSTDRCSEDFGGSFFAKTPETKPFENASPSVFKLPISRSSCV